MHKSTNYFIFETLESCFKFNVIFFSRCANGGESLFQASDDDEMAQWVNSINQVAEAGASGSASGGRAQTLSAGT